VSVRASLAGAAAALTTATGIYLGSRGLRYFDAALVGYATATVVLVFGLIGAAGGLGGFLPPIVMGLVFQATGDYAIGLMLLSDVALAGLVFTAWRLGTGAAEPAKG
jgi:NNP family nitrate/nitrite transporter-like MFS transporter